MIEIEGLSDSSIRIAGAVAAKNGKNYKPLLDEYKFMTELLIRGGHSLVEFNLKAYNASSVFKEMFNYIDIDIDLYIKDYTSLSSIGKNNEFKMRSRLIELYNNINDDYMLFICIMKMFMSNARCRKIVLMFDLDDTRIMNEHGISSRVYLFMNKFLQQKRNVIQKVYVIPREYFKIKTFMKSAKFVICGKEAFILV